MLQGTVNLPVVQYVGLCCLKQRSHHYAPWQYLVAATPLAEGNVLMDATYPTRCVDAVPSSLECFKAVIFFDTFVES